MLWLTQAAAACHRSGYSPCIASTFAPMCSIVRLHLSAAHVLSSCPIFVDRFACSRLARTAS